ncbi:hypothetical protein AcW1_001041, partial [Taiwanofungus camphoratus]
MGRPPPFLFGYCYPCSDYHSSTSTDENMSDYYSSDSDYSDEETDATGGFRHRAYPKHLLLSSPATAEHHKTFKTPPLECNTQSDLIYGMPMKSSMSDLHLKHGIKDPKMLNFLWREFSGKIACGYPV